MKVINNKEEYEEFSPYGKQFIKNYPKEYPCIVKKEWTNCGIMGDHQEVRVAYYPKYVSINAAFYKGLDYNWETLRF